MVKWSDARKFGGLLLPLLLVCFLSFILPQGLWTSLSTVPPVIREWWRIPAVLVLAFILYAAGAWRWPESRLKVSVPVMRVTLFLSYLTALLCKLWYRNFWVTSIWFWISVVVITHLTKSGETSTTNSAVRPLNPEKLVFFPDEPVSKIDDDGLNRVPLAETLVRGILSYTDEPAICIALNGEWGSGKTTVMQFADEILKAQDYQTVWVNAWLHGTPQGMSAAFLSEITALVRAFDIPMLSAGSISRYQKVASEILKSSGLQVGEAFGAVLDSLPSGEELAEAKTEVSALIHDVVGAHKKLVVFIDDLDRCSPDSVIGTLQFLKEIADLDHCVFVVGMDDRSIVEMIESRLGVNGRAFLDKVVHISLELNRPASFRSQKLFVPAIGRALAISEDEARNEAKFVFEWLGGNPRDVKHVLNNLAAMREVLGQLLGIGGSESSSLIMGAELIRYRYKGVHIALRNEETFSQLDELSWERTSGKGDEKQAQVNFESKVGSYLGLDPLGTKHVLSALVHCGFLNGLLSSSVPRSIFFSYEDPPYWLSDHRFNNMLADLKSGVRRVSDILDTLWAEHSERAVEFVGQSVVRKNAELRVRSQTQLGKTSALETNNFYRDVFSDSIKYQIDTGRKVMGLQAVRNLLAGELNYLPEANALPFCRTIILWNFMTPRECWELLQVGDNWGTTLPASILDDVEVQRKKQISSLYLWDQFLRSLATGGRVSEEDPFVNSILYLDADVLLLPEAHEKLVEAATTYADSPEWIVRYRQILRAWLRWKSIAEVPERHQFWVDACRTGLMDALQRVAGVLQLKPEAVDWLSEDMEKLQFMTAQSENEVQKKEEADDAP